MFRSIKLASFFAFALLTKPPQEDLNAAPSNGIFQPLGSSDLQNSVLVLGGSFSPPTIEHMGLMARLMTRFGFSEGRMLVSYPYKPDAAPADVSLSLTRTAVERFDEVLGPNSLPYSNLNNTAQGEITFLGRGAQTYHLKVDDSDIRTRNATTLVAHRQMLQSERIPPEKLFWISGGDSFASIQSWGEDWRNLFDGANWIVVSRPGFDQSEKALSFDRENPLQNLFPHDFLENYNYRFDSQNQVHIYGNKTPGRPSIYVVNQPVLDDSSSKNRKSLASEADRTHAQAGLQPSVFMECIERGYYSGADGTRSYNLYSKKNLSIILHWLYERIQMPHSTPQDRKLFQRMSELAVKLSKDGNTFETSMTHKMKRTLKDLISDIAPRLKQRFTNARRQKVFGGEAAEILSYRHRLLRGNPDAIVGRVLLKSPLGAGGSGLELNLVESRLPRWVPLKIRQWDDTHVTWHDLNISTNELVALLENERAAQSLRDISNREPGLFSHLLLSAILADPRAESRFHLFALRRYFVRTSLGEIPRELLGKYSREERAFIDAARQRTNEVRESLGNARVGRLQRIVGIVYATATVLRGKPELSRSPDFWNDLIDLYLSDYPGKRASFKDPEKLEELVVAIRHLQSREPELFPPFFALRYRGKNLEFRTQNSLDSDLLRQSLFDYLESYWSFLNHSQVRQGTETWEVLPMDSRGLDLQESNLTWAIEMRMANARREMKKLEGGLHEALRRLQFQPHTPSAPKKFQRAFHTIRTQANQVLSALSEVQMEWVRTKKAFDTGLRNLNENEIGGFEGLSGRADELNRELNVLVEKLRSINFLILGTESIDLRSSPAIQARLQELANCSRTLERLSAPPER